MSADAVPEDSLFYMKLVRGVSRLAGSEMTVVCGVSRKVLGRMELVASLPAREVIA
jgi:hypothetical protein